MPKPGSRLSCIKQSNGRYYISKSKDLSLMGSGGYQAGFSSHEACSTDIPRRGVVNSCIKQNNGRYYPTNVNTFSIVGPTSYQASYPSRTSCLADQ